jgi:NAD-dependent dihydropyrimidine dehydrogenase PreA subunit
MPHKITEDCLSCGLCEPACTEGAISQGDMYYVIDPAKCSDCATCVQECPNEAIVPA